MIKLTGRQQQVLDLIQGNIDSTGFPPTRAEIATKLGFRSANAAEEHLKALAKKGAIEMIPGASRGIRILTNTNSGLPIVGKVAAGEPVNSSTHIRDHVNIEPSFFSPAADYLLEVHGDSMVNVCIMDGDYLAVKESKTAANGQIIVARVDGEVTVKRFKQGTNKQLVELVAENDHYQPILVDLTQQDFTIEGLSVGVIRRHH